MDKKFPWGTIIDRYNLLETEIITYRVKDCFKNAGNIEYYVDGYNYNTFHDACLCVVCKAFGLNEDEYDIVNMIIEGLVARKST